MAIDLPPKPELWLPPKPAIIRSVSAEDAALVRAARREHTREGNFLPGWFPAGAAGISGGPSVIMTVLTQTTTSTANTIIAPASIIAGDLLMLFDWATGGSGGAPTSVYPSTFTGIQTNATTEGGADRRGNMSYKVAAGTEGGTTITGMNGSSSNRKIMVRFRFNIPLASVSVVSQGGTLSNANQAAQTRAAATAPYIVVGHWGCEDTITSRTFTIGGVDAKDEEFTTGATQYAAYHFFNTVATPASVVVDSNDDGEDNLLQSAAIQLTI